MHAVKDREYSIYFGGSYTENWSEDYTLSIAYKDSYVPLNTEDRFGNKK